VTDGCDHVPLEDHLPEDLPWTETAAGGIRILPHEHGDGFTIHALRRRN
jgi:16S rRNA C967 or C1407 C5-methylase (RsmB/RsmF family)